MLGKELHLFLMVHRFQFSRRRVHRQVGMRYLNLPRKRRALHRQAQPKRLLPEGYPQILEREGNARIKQGFRSLSLDSSDYLLVHQPSLVVSLIS